MKYLLLFVLTLSLQAKLLLSPYDALKTNLGDDVHIEKKNILLSKEEAKQIQKHAATKLDTNIYRTFRVYQNDTLIAYGILVVQKVRSKDTAVLSIISPEGILKTIEIIAFNEPMEYIPSEHWIKVLEGKRLTPGLNLGKDIPTITGSTLSARAATKAARIALALFDVKYKQ